MEAALADTPVTVIVGPRQCGKSTLADVIAQERGASYVSLDDAAARTAATSDPTGFIEERELPLFIDEFQKAPELLDTIKNRVDQTRRSGADAAGLFLLTGSANIWGTLQISDSLTGRAERIQLWPLSQGEIEGQNEKFLVDLLNGTPPRLQDQPIGRKPIANRLVRGGYPEMLKRDTPQRRSRWVQSYLDMILERDARDLMQKAQQLDELPNLLRLAASQVGNLVEATNMGRSIGMKRDSVRRYLKLLELLFLIWRAPAWSRNLGQQLIKAPKIWLPDSGLASQLTGYGSERFEEDDTGFAGALFENFVASELLKQATREVGLRLHHFRTAGGREVDVVVEASDGRAAGIEVKLSATPSKNDFTALAHLRDKLGARFAAGVVVHTGKETLPFGDRLWAVPVAGIWA